MHRLPQSINKKDNVKAGEPYQAKCEQSQIKR